MQELMRRPAPLRVSTRKYATAASAGLVVLSCAPVHAAKSGSSEPLDAASITYNLPMTVALVKADLTLRDCQTALMATSTITVSAIPAPSSNGALRFTVSGSDLKSALKSREVKIETHDNGAIKSINASVSDRTFAIIGNVLKFAATIAPFLAADNNPKALGDGLCNDATTAALAQAAADEREIVRLRRTLANTPPKDIEGVRKKIDMLAADLAQLESGPLRLTLARTVAFDSGSKANNFLVNWKESDFAKWLKSTTDTPTSDFRLAFCARAKAESDFVCDTSIAENGKPPSGVDTPENLPADADRKKSLVFREPVTAQIKIVSASDRNMLDLNAYERAVLVRPTPPALTLLEARVSKDETLVSTTIPVAQWGDISLLSLRAGLGQSKAVSLTMDPFGKRTSFSWSSGAGAEGVTAGLAGAAEGVAALVGAAQGAELKSVQQEIAELEARQKLNKLETCRAVIESGGFVCPD